MKSKLIVLSSISLLLIGSFLIYKSDIFISPETKVERIINNPEEHLEGDMKEYLESFFNEIDQFIEEYRSSGTYDHIYMHVEVKNNADIAIDANTTSAVIFSHGVEATERTGNIDHLGYGFIVFLLDRNHLKWDIVDVLILPFEEGRSGYSYPKDFEN